MFSQFPPLETKIEFKNYVSKELHLTYNCTFTYRKPSVRTLLEISKTEKLLLGGFGAILGDEERIFCRMLATLKCTIVIDDKTPDWWKEGIEDLNFYDVDFLGELYNRCLKFDEEWAQELHKNLNGN